MPGTVPVPVPGTSRQYCQKIHKKKKKICVKKTTINFNSNSFFNSNRFFSVLFVGPPGTCMTKMLTTYLQKSQPGQASSARGHLKFLRIFSSSLTCGINFSNLQKRTSTSDCVKLNRKQKQEQKFPSTFNIYVYAVASFCFPRLISSTSYPNDASFPRISSPFVVRLPFMVFFFSLLFVSPSSSSSRNFA